MCIYMYMYILWRCDMVLHQAFRARHVHKSGIGGEVRHGVTSGVSCETSLNKHGKPHLRREYQMFTRNALLRAAREVPAAVSDVAAPRPGHALPYWAVTFIPMPMPKTICRTFP